MVQKKIKVILLILIAALTLQLPIALAFAKKPQPAPSPSASSVKKYVCPMRCTISDKPGKCKKCGMELWEATPAS